jgi:hypothetical protein
MRYMFTATLITLVPDAFPGPLGVSVLERAREKGIWSLETVDLRTFGVGKHRNVDDTPAGGGAGMVIRPDVAAAAIDSIPRDGRPLIYLSPRGKPFDQQKARDWAAGPGLVFFCGRFEGLDERAIEGRDMEEVSLGDFVLAGGEVAAMALIEAVVRRCGWKRSLADGGILRAGPAGTRSLYDAARVGRPSHAGHSAVRRSQANRRMACEQRKDVDKAAPPRFIRRLLQDPQIPAAGDWR